MPDVPTTIAFVLAGLSFVVLVVMIVGALRQPPARKPIPAPRSTYQASMGPPPPHLWPLAADAWDSVGRNWLWDRLVPEISQTEAQQLLAAEWRVTTNSELERFLNWLATRGDRTLIANQVRVVSTLSAADLDEMLTGLRAEAESSSEAKTNLAKLEAIHGNVHNICDLNLAGWDWVPYISVTRIGVAAGMMAENAAWEHLFTAQKALRAAYSGWPELGTALAVGEWFGRGADAEAEEVFQRRLELRDRLLKPPDGPWVVVAWDDRTTPSR